MKNLTEYLIEGKINFYLPKDKKELKKAIKML